MRLLHGEVAAAEWRLDAALSHYTEALEFNPNDAWLNNCAARVSLLMADTKLALRHLEASVRYSSSHRVLQQGSWKPSQTHIGQMLDEYRIDRKALDRLHRCLASSDPAGALSQMMIAYPDYTPAAISLLISLRQTGHLASLNSIKDKKTCWIPATIAQYWDVDIPADVEALCDGWRAMHPSFSYIRFSKAGARRFLIEKGLPEAWRPSTALPSRRCKPISSGLPICFTRAVITSTPTTAASRRSRRSTPAARDLILYQEDFGTVGNNFIGVRPQHPVMENALASAVTAVNRGDADIVWLATGPALLTRSLAVYLAESLPARLATTLIVERHELFRIAAAHTMTAYKHSKKHWTRTTSARPHKPSDVDRASACQAV